jgi:hypothetical protein
MLMRIRRLLLAELPQGTTPRQPVVGLRVGDPGDPGDPGACPPHGASDSRLSSCCNTIKASSFSVACSVDCCCNNADLACNCCSRVRSGDVGSASFFGLADLGDGGIVLADGTWSLLHRHNYQDNGVDHVKTKRQDYAKDMR